MPLFEYSTTVTADTPLVTTAETVVATLSGVTIPSPGTRVQLHGWVQLTLGTATTAVTARIRRGTDATGALIGEANAEQIKTAAGSTEPFTIDVEERPSGELVSASYVLTLTQTAATGNGSALQAELKATVG